MAKGKVGLNRAAAPCGTSGRVSTTAEFQGMAMLDVPDKRLADLAYEQMLETILSGEVAAGSLLNERKVAASLDMSRTPVRDAMLRLEHDGLLVRQGIRGLQVRELRVEDFLDALQVRMLLEPEAAGIAARRMVPDTLDEVEERLKVVLASAGRDSSLVDREEVRTVDNLLHGRIADAVGNEQLSRIIRNLRRQTQIFDLKSMPERLEDTCAEHLAILRCIQQEDSRGARSAMKAHLGRVRRSIVARLTRI